MRSRLSASLVLLVLVLACGSSSAPSDADVIEQLRQAGSDLQQQHPIEFFFYFPVRLAAERACSTLESQGFSAVVFQAGASTSEFLCQANKPLVPALETLTHLRSQFESLAAEFGGEYDGWGSPVVK